MGGCGFCGAGRESIFFFYHLFETLVRTDNHRGCDVNDLSVASTCDLEQIPESLRTMSHWHAWSSYICQETGCGDLRPTRDSCGLHASSMMNKDVPSFIPDGIGREKEMQRHMCADLRE